MNPNDKGEPNVHKLSNVVSTGHVWLFKFRLIKIKCKIQLLRSHVSSARGSRGWWTLPGSRTPSASRVADGSTGQADPARVACKTAPVFLPLTGMKLGLCQRSTD